jgi:ABC-type transport system involved in multi-copper enzyme maturation permease subunit
MSSPRTLSSIARYEMVLIFRSWAFRIFSGLALAAVTLITISVALPRYSTFFFNRALSGAFPLLAIKLFNLFLGLIAVFLATEFLKRDRRQDTSQVYFTHSFSNGTYVLGKFLGIFFTIVSLSVLVLLITGIIHIFFSQTIFAWQPYLLYFFLIGIPTIVFLMGLSIFLGFLIRSQAVVYLLVLVYAFFVLAVVGSRFFFAFDSFALYEPVMYSGFIGLGNARDLLLLRGAYFVLGLGLVFGSTLLMRRLRQSSWLNRAAGVLSLALAILSIFLFTAYYRGKTSDQVFRTKLRAQSRGAAEQPALTLAACDLRLKLQGHGLSAEADLTLANDTDSPIETILLSLNPGLKVINVQGPAGLVPFGQENYLVSVRPSERVDPGRDIRLSISYAGDIDERYCYLDVGKDRYQAPLKLWLISVPKRYAVVSPRYVHLSPECGWYPRPGIPPALLFPKTIKQDLSRYTLSVSVPEGLTAVSQGELSVNDNGSEKLFLFRPEGLLPQISLTVGRYEKKSIIVDKTEYSLFLMPGHDRFTSFFADLKDDLAAFIRQTRNEYEVLLGLDYPYKRLSLVETPIQISSYSRLWNTAQEQVQPELVFLPEMAALCQGADFRAANRQFQRFRAGPGMNISPKDLERQLLNRFVRSNLTETAFALPGLLRPGLLGIRFESNSESRYGIFPNFLTYTTHFAISDWPLFGYVLEAYLRGRVSSSLASGLRGMLGISGQDEVFKTLMNHALAELLTESEQEGRQLTPILEAKGKQLMAVIQAELGTGDFADRLTKWLQSHRFRAVNKKEAAEFFRSLGGIDLDQTFAAWYGEKGVPGFLFENLQSYRVVEGERQKTQILFQVANSTGTDGVISVSSITRGRMGGRMQGGSAQPAEGRYYLVPARTVKEIGIILDQPAVMTFVDTYISQNQPSSFSLPFLNPQPRPGLVPFEGEKAHPYVPVDSGFEGEYIVDNEDPGFNLPRGERENWLRRLVQKAFASPGEEEEGETIPLRNFINPPVRWTPVIMQNFYGRFVRSAYLKKSGDGTNRVAWSADLRDGGDYDIYFYYDGIGGGMRGGFGGQRGGDAGGVRGGTGQPAGGRMQPFLQAPGAAQQGRRLQPGKKYFVVHHEDGEEDVVVDLKEARPGWNMIGTFRLAAGPSTIELTDKNEEVFVLADAVRWARHK